MMSNILVKVSGSLVSKQEFYDWLRSVCVFPDKVYILCGGGEEISKTLKREGIPFKFGPQGREIKNLKGRFLAEEVLKKKRLFIEIMLNRMNIDYVDIFIPVLSFKGKPFHMNADKFALSLYPDFDKIYIVTFEGNPKNFSKKLEKLEVIHL